MCMLLMCVHWLKKRKTAVQWTRSPEMDDFRAFEKRMASPWRSNKRVIILLSSSEESYGELPTRGGETEMQRTQSFTQPKHRLEGCSDEGSPPRNRVVNLRDFTASSVEGSPPRQSSVVFARRFTTSSEEGSPPRRSRME